MHYSIITSYSVMNAIKAMPCNLSAEQRTYKLYMQTYFFWPASKKNYGMSDKAFQTRIPLSSIVLKNY